MVSNEYINFLTNYLLFNAPILLANFTGVVLSLIFRKRVGKAAIFSMIAFLLFLSVMLISLLHSTWVYLYVRPNYGAGSGSASTVAILVSIIRALLETLAFIPLFIAIFAKRKELNINEPPLPDQHLT